MTMNDHPFRFLFVEDDETDVDDFRQHFQRSHVDGMIVHIKNGREALKRIISAPLDFDVIIVDHDLNGMSGLEFCREFIEHNITLPRVLLTNPKNERFIIEFKKLGFINDYLIKDTERTYLEILPLLILDIARKYREDESRKRYQKEVEMLEQRFRTVLAKNADGIVIVDADGKIDLVNAAAKAIFGRNASEMLGHPLEFSIKPEETREVEIKRKNNKKTIVEMRVVSIDWKDKKACLASLRDITDRKNMEKALEKKNQELIQAMDELKKANEKILKMSERDGLTGLYNRLYFNAAIEREVARAHRYKKELSMCIMDLDHFKKVNDTEGHPCGDVVLIEIGKLLKEWTRQSDVVCRFGGEEFIVILPETDIENAVKMSERFRKKVEDHTFIYNEKTIHITVSIGVDSLSHSDSIKDLIFYADKALYQAKLTRNCVARADRLIKQIDRSQKNINKEKKRPINSSFRNMQGMISARV